MADQPPGINFKKIIENVLSYLVTSVFLGACVIVWKGATTVDERVKGTEKNLQVLIDNLSSKLSVYEVQLIAQSNQMAAIHAEIKTRSTNWMVRSAEREQRDREQRAVIQQDISQQLKTSK